MWTIKKIINSKKITLCSIEENHPNVQKHGYIPLHRIIVENNINRVLSSIEIVHHINGNNKDNCIENLQIVSRSEHAKIHAMKSNNLNIKSAEIKLIKCKNCGLELKIPVSIIRMDKIYKRKNKFCSHSCSIKYYRNLHKATNIT